MIQIWQSVVFPSYAEPIRYQIVSLDKPEVNEYNRIFNSCIHTGTDTCFKLSFWNWSLSRCRLIFFILEPIKISFSPHRWCLRKFPNLRKNVPDPIRSAPNYFKIPYNQSKRKINQLPSLLKENFAVFSVQLKQKS